MAFITDEERALAASQESWISYVRWALFFCGAMYILLGLCFGPLFALGLYFDDSPDAPPAIFGVFLGLFTLVLCGGIGVFNFVAAWALGRGKRWGWISSVILGGIYAPSGCFPFGVLILYGLLQDKVRKIYYD